MKPLYHAHDEKEFQRLKSGMENLLKNYQLMGIPEVADIHVRGLGNSAIEVTPNDVSKIDYVTVAPIIKESQSHEGEIVMARRDSVKIKLSGIEYTVNYNPKKD